MEKVNKRIMNYDETIQKAESIVKDLEQAEALSMEDYKAKATEAKQLLDLCEKQLTTMEKDLLV